MAELATAYISVVAETSGIPRAVRSALGQADGDAQRAGRSMGSSMAGALGTTLKTGAAAAGAAASVAIGTSLKKGFDRLSAIDEAKGKLAGLGNSTQTTARVMDSALASVKGTAFGLGDAATISASAIAAGIKPGQQLTQYLKTTADAASIAGTSLGDMGSIFNQVQTSQQAYTDDLNQLADRGIPIYQWLGQEMGVAAGEVKGLASKGKVSSEEFFRAIQKNIGGAALESGKTVKGSFQNMIAAMGRLGAAVEGPTFTRLPAFFTDLTSRIDAFTPKAQAMAASFDANIFDNWGPKIQDAIAAFRDSGSFDEIKSTIAGLGSALAGMGPAVSGIASSLAEASAALGVSGWQVFLMTLQATSTVLEAVTPILSGLSNLMDSNQVAVTGLVAAWLAFKTIPAIMGRATASLAPLTTRAATAATALGGVASASNRVVQAGAAGSVTMGRFGSSIAQIGRSAPVVGRMQSSFVNAAAGASRFGRSAGTAAAAGAGLRSAGAGLAGVFGGPVGIALTGAVIAGGAWASSAARQKAATDDYKTALQSLAEEQKSMRSQLLQSKGVATEGVFTSLSRQVDEYSNSLDAASAKDAKWTDVTKSWFSASDWGKNLTGNTDDDSVSRMDQAATKARQTKAALNELGITSADLGKKIAGGAGQWETFRNQLARSGEGGQAAAGDLQKLRDAFVQQQDIARKVTPGISELGAAMQVMGDKGASAGDKLTALKAAMDAMNPARNQFEAVAQYGEALRKAADAAQGIDGTAFNQAGKINSMSEAGVTLGRTLTDLAEKSAQVATTGGDMGAVAKGNEDQFRALAEATGQPIQKIRDLYAELGGKTVDLVVRTQGTNDTIKELAQVKAAFDQQPGKKTITVESDQVNQQTMNYLRQIGATVTTMPDGKTLQITTNDQASARLILVTQNMSVLDAKRANPTLDLNTVEFAAKDGEARSALQALQGMNPTPAAGMIIQDLLNGQAVSMTKLDELSRTVTTPQAKLLIDAIMANIKTVNDGLDNVARTRIANIVAKIGPGAGDAPNLAEMTPEQRRALGYADGGIRKYANGGINALESYANGKLPSQAVIQKAQPNSLVQWAEPETGGEAFIPLAQGKRGRSTSILTAVAQMFGFDLVPQGNLPGTVSGMAGALSGGALSGLLARTGLDRMYKFAAGGVTAEGLKALAQGTGASRPLTGAPYVWGGTNWGDCSGAMSAFARFAAGLDPFGGRFSTATMGAQLQQMGFSMGRGTSGDLRFGWHNGGPGGGHTSGTLPDGTAIEMGGGNGGGMLGGGAANADDPQHNEHAYMTIGPAYTDAGADPGGFVVRPDGTIAFNPGNGNFSAGGSSAGSSAGSAESGGTSLSTRLGSAAGSFIEGQIASMLSVLSVNDSPGALAAIAEYENQVKSSKSGSGSAVDASALKTSYETAKAEADKRYEAEVLRRKQEYEAERKKLQDQQKATKDVAKKAELDRKLADLKTKYENDSLAAKQKHDDAALQAKQKFDEVKKTGASADAATSAQQSSVTDPGSTVPKKGEDLGVRAGVSGGGIKEAFKSGLRDAWRVGQPWTDSEWIVNKESSWNPAAKNGKYFGLIQAGPEVYQAAGKSPTTTDPREQGQVFDKYVGDRYQDPMRARAHHQANNWYDQGGAAIGTGLMAKNVIAPERVLSPRQTAAFESMVQRDFQAGGGTGALEAKFDRLIDLMSKRPPLMPVVVPDEAGRRRVERDRTVQRHLVSK